MESFLSEAGYAAIFLFGFLEACCAPIPSEVTFGFGGVLAYQGHLNIVGVIIVGIVAELIGSMVSFTVGRVGGRPLVHKFGRYVLLTQSDIDRAERFFAGRGAWSVVLGRMLPVVRSFVSIVAGFIEMPAPLTPNSSTHRSAIRCGASSSVMSRTSVEPPSSPIVSSSSDWSAGTSSPITWAPSRARTWAMARPIPRDAPVTSANRPAWGRSQSMSSALSALAPICTTWPDT